MDVKKLLDDPLESCYAVARIQHGTEDFLLVASEVEGACLSYNLNKGLEKSVVWEDVGGTMSIIQIPNSMDFLATQKFYPGFDAKSCQIVYGRFDSGEWHIKKIADFPYLHRFDLIADQKRILFVGCTIANSKSYVEDWSDKGKIFVATFNSKELSLENLHPLPLRLLKNHGYYRVHKEGYSLITGVEGIFKLTYPGYSDTGDWRLDQIFSEETSDIVRVDLNGDGYPENILIQDFHGDKFRILSHDFCEELYHYPTATPFGHAIWGGQLLNRPVTIFGYRAGQANLALYYMKNQAVCEEVIEEGVSSSNCLAFEKDGKCYVFSANNGKHRVAFYELSQL